MNDDVSLHPEWKAAAERFLASDFQPGQLIEHQWFYDAFGMKPPMEAETVAEYQKLQLKYLQQFQGFSKWLLEEQALALFAKPGAGYEIAKPAEQTKRTMDDFTAQVTKQFRKAGSRLTNIRFGELSDSERREHTDAINKMALLRGMVPRPRRVIEDGDEENAA